MLEKAVIYPIANGNYNDSNHELILSLRSIDRFLQDDLMDDIPVFIVSEECPPYLSDKVNYVKCDGYMDAMRKACSIAKKFLWMNDDISLMRPHTFEEFEQWPRPENPVSPEKIESMTEGNGWSRRKGEVLKKLREKGYTTFDYSSHTPYLYEADKLLKILDEFDEGYKTPFETAYGNVYEIENRPSCWKLSRFHDKALPINLTPYTIINYSDNADHPHIRGVLLGMLPEPCQYESYGNIETHKLTFCQIK